MAVEGVFVNNTIAVDFAELYSKNDKPRRVVKKVRRENYKEKLQEILKNNGGKYISFKGDEEKYGLLVAGAEYNKKYWFVIMNKDRKIETVPVTTTFRNMRSIPGNLSVLDYLYQHESSSLYNSVRDWFEENEDYKLVDNIAIVVKKFKPKYNKSKKTK